MPAPVKLKVSSITEIGLSEEQAELHTEIAKVQGRKHPAAADVTLLTSRMVELSAEIKGATKELTALQADLGLFDEDYRRRRAEKVNEIEGLADDIDDLSEVHRVVMSAAVDLDTLSKRARPMDSEKPRPRRRRNSK